MSGNLSSVRSSARFVLDESLVPAVAEALRLVDYDIRTLPTGMTDEEIIEWCREHEAVWIHADDSARREHREQLASSQIRTIFVYRPQGKMTGKEQLRIISFILPKFISAQSGRSRPRHRHYRVTVENELAAPRLHPRNL